jgi:hypothetical protein
MIAGAAMSQFEKIKIKKKCQCSTLAASTIIVLLSEMLKFLSNLAPLPPCPPELPFCEGK